MGTIKATLRAVVLAGLLLHPVRARAQEGQVGDGPSALPAAHRVGLVSPPGRLVSLSATGSYGYTEEVLGTGDSHHRISGSVAAALWPIRWLGVGLELDGRYDRHSDGDDGFVGDPYLHVRAGDLLPGSAVGIGADLRLWLPGSNAPSVEFDATTLDVSALVSAHVGNVTLGGMLGFRYDRSARSVQDPAALSDADRLALGLNDDNALLLGLAASGRAGQLELMGELSWDLVVGGDAPSATKSPLRLAAGAALWLADDTLSLRTVIEAGLSGRPDVSAGQPLVNVEPRIRVWLGLGVRLPPPEESTVETHEEPEATTGTVAGTVLDESGAPLAGATVSLDGRETTTDATGRFELDDVPPGQHTVTVTAPGRPPETRTVTVEAGAAAAPMSLTLGGATGTVRGEIRRPDDSPLVGATVRFGDQETTTDREGHFELEGVPAGSAEVTVEAEGWHTGTLQLEVPPGGEAEGTLALERALPAGQIRGLIQSFDGTPLAASVRVEGADVELTADEEGRFEVDVPPGTYTVVLEADGHVTQRRRVQVEDNGVTVLNVDLRRRR